MRLIQGYRASLELVRHPTEGMGWTKITTSRPLHTSGATCASPCRRSTSLTGTISGCLSGRDGLTIGETVQSRGHGLDIFNFGLRRVRADRGFDGGMAISAPVEAFRNFYVRLLGQIAGGVVHDFNNLLAVIVSILRLARRRQHTPDREQFLDSATDAAHRTGQLTRQLLVFAGQNRPEPKVVDPHECVASLAKGLLRQSLRGDIEIEPADLKAALREAMRSDLNTA